MFLRLFLAYLTLLVLALAVFGVVTTETTHERILTEIEHRLETQAQMLRSIVLSSALPSAIQKTLQELGTTLESRLTVIGGDGRVLADSHGRPEEMDNHNARPEIIEARAHGRGRNVRFSDTVRYDMMYVALPQDPGHGEAIVVRAALPLTQINREISALHGTIIAAFIVIGLVGAAGTALLARWMMRPLREIRSVAEAIGSGDFSRRAPQNSPGEIRDVAGAINRMSVELASQLTSLREETSKLETVISSMQEGVMAVDPTGMIELHNKAAETLLDLHADPRRLKLWEAVRVPGIREKLNRVLEERTTERFQLEVGPRQVGFCICPLREGSGAILVAHDSTEQHRYDSLRKEFVANVSHELRTPLSIVRGYVETLREGAWQDAAKAPEFLETLDTQVRRLAAIVEDLLQLSRLDSAGQIARPADLDVKPLLDRICTAFLPLAEKKRQQLSWNVEEVRIIRADPLLLERAIGNLVDNAIKYTPESGTIRVRARKRNGGIEMEVQDNGPGIPAEDQPRVFERFYRVDKSRSRDLGGTGLGLAIVKHIAQLHGGRVELRSPAGSGTTFTLTLPG